MSVTVPADYTGKYSITKNTHNIVKIQQFIDYVEPTILNELFGVELYTLYLIGLAELPTPNPIYVALRDAKITQSDCGGIIESKGIHEMLLGFVYFKYYAETFAQASSNGNVVDNPENSTKASDTQANLIARQNDAVKTFRAIQQYIMDNSDVYPTFKGQKKLLTTWF